MSKLKALMEQRPELNPSMPNGQIPIKSPSPHDLLAGSIERRYEETKQDLEELFQSLPKDVKKKHWELTKRGTLDPWEELKLTFFVREIMVCQELDRVVGHLRNALSAVGDLGRPEITEPPKLVRTKRFRDTAEREITDLQE